MKKSFEKISKENQEKLDRIMPKQKNIEERNYIVKSTLSLEKKFTSFFIFIVIIVFSFSLIAHYSMDINISTVDLKVYLLYPFYFLFIGFLIYVSYSRNVSFKKVIDVFASPKEFLFERLVYLLFAIIMILVFYFLMFH